MDDELETRVRSPQSLTTIGIVAIELVKVSTSCYHVNYWFVAFEFDKTASLNWRRRNFAIEQQTIALREI